MNSNGIALSAGAGKLTAEWIALGSPSLDATRIDIRRFAPFQATRRYIRTRVREVPSFFGVQRGPGVDYRTARDVRRGVLHDRLAKAGAHFSTVAGWEQADWFGSGETPPEECIRREQRALEERGGLIDRSADAKFLLRGPDATRFLTRLCGTVSTIEAGSAGRAILLNEQGGVEADAIAIRTGDGDWWLVADAGEQVRLGDWLRRRAAPEERVGILDVTSDRVSLALIGAPAKSLLGSLADGGSNDSEDAVFAIEIGSASARAVRDPIHGGLRLLVATEQAGHAFDAIVKLTGAPLCGAVARDRSRIWRGIPRVGAELSPHVNAAAADLGEWMALDGEPFIGREALRREQAVSSRPRIAAFTLLVGAPVPGEREPIWHADRAVGFVTSCAPHHTSQAVALLALTEADVGAELHVKLDARRFTRV
jgi:4-methylaminobutanoate oxidase (formaldehyde-forming)